MNWQEYIIADPGVHVGKPVIKGTRLTVEFIVDLLSQGCSQQQIATNYHLAPEQVRACLLSARSGSRE